MKDEMARVTKAVDASLNVDDYQRNLVLSFLSGKQNPFGDYSSLSGEIVGILKAMKDEMDKDLNGAISDEEKAAAGFEELATAKKEEISAASSAIETKTQRSGELAVSVVTTADDIEDTTKELDDLQSFLANLASQCATKKKEWDERCQVRAEEVAAISEAIKILNDDDALDLFKKTLSPESVAASTSTRKFGLLQQRTSASVVARARNMVAVMTRKGGPHKAQLELLEMSLKAKKVDFSKVLAMIDGMEKVLKEEQADDDSTKAFCDKDLEKSAAEKKDTEEAIAASEAFIEETTAESAATAEEIASLQKEIKALDKAVAEATEQRKEEHADFIVFQQQSNAALQLIDKAKNRLMKFYRPTMYKEAPTKELTEEEKILAASGRSDMIATAAPEMIPGTTQTVYAQIRSHTLDDAAPAPPPETWGAYQKKEQLDVENWALHRYLCGVARAHKALQTHCAAVELSSAYNLLGVEQGCDAAALKRAYREMCRKHHPDKGGDAILFQACHVAYTQLLNRLGHAPEGTAEGGGGGRGDGAARGGEGDRRSRRRRRPTRAGPR